MSESMNKVSQLMEITGLDRNTAENVLQVNNDNLEQAINYHLENNCNSPDYSTSSTKAAVENDYNCISSKNSSSYDQKINKISNVTEQKALSSSSDYNISDTGNTSTSLTSNSDKISNIRAPIPSRREQLLLPEDDNFRYRKRRAPAFTVCPLRNFAREAELQEQQLAAASTSDVINSYSTAPNSLNRDYLTSSIFTSPNRYNEISSLSFTKKARLEDLFRPPTDLLFWGTFQSARDYATLRNRWLIVNLQDNSEFKSQILNRDIWPDPDLKDLILKYFIFWQVSVDNPEGLRFKIFYHVKKMPYVCVIDPRTGENKFSCDVVTPQIFYSDLNNFLKENSYKLDFSKNDSTIIGLASTSNTSHRLETPPKRKLKTSELSEEDQLELAIKNSLKETTTVQSHTINDDDNSLDGDTTVCYDDSTTQSEDLNDVTTGGDNTNNSDDLQLSSVTNDIKESFALQDKCNYEQYLGDKNDQITKIQLRLPNGDRDYLEWPSTTKLKGVKLYVQSKYPDITKNSYKIILSFSRQNILDLDDKLSLQMANLHPSVILHLHPDE